MCRAAGGWDEWEGGPGRLGRGEDAQSEFGRGTRWDGSCVTRHASRVRRGASRGAGGGWDEWDLWGGWDGGQGSRGWAGPGGHASCVTRHASRVRRGAPGRRGWQGEDGTDGTHRSLGASPLGRNQRVRKRGAGHGTARRIEGGDLLERAGSARACLRSVNPIMDWVWYAQPHVFFAPRTDFES